MRRIGTTARIGRIITRQESGFDTARVRTGANIVIFKANRRENIPAERARLRRFVRSLADFSSRQGASFYGRILNHGKGVQGPTGPGASCALGRFTGIMAVFGSTVGTSFLGSYDLRFRLAECTEVRM